MASWTSSATPEHKVCRLLTFWCRLQSDRGRRGDASRKLRCQAATDRRAPDACNGQGPHESQRACRTDRLQCGTDCELGARARADVPDRADKAMSCARREAGVAAVLGAPPPLISSVARMSAATSGVVVHPRISLRSCGLLTYRSRPGWLAFGGTTMAPALG